jgi:hypothetical protein
MPTPDLHPEERARLERRIQALGVFMDSGIRVPGLGFTIGLDPLLGLVPGGGDLVGAAIGVYSMVLARRLGVKKRTLAAMATNLGVDMLVGAVPVAGDLFDFAFKAHSRNLRLLGLHPQQVGDLSRDPGADNAGGANAGPARAGRKRVVNEAPA